MRLTILVAAAAIVLPAAVTAHTASAPGMTQGVTDLSAAKKKKKPEGEPVEIRRAIPVDPDMDDEPMQEPARD